MDTKQKGDITESKILSRLVELGYSTLIPWGDNDRYDLVFENEHGDFNRVQCKTGQSRKNGDIVSFSVCSSSVHRGDGERHTYHGEIDYFAVWFPANNKIYLVPFEEVSEIKRHASLRLTETKNGQTKGVRLAKNFEL